MRLLLILLAVFGLGAMPWLAPNGAKNIRVYPPPTPEVSTCELPAEIPCTL